jgi:hypothetical protein
MDLALRRRSASGATFSLFPTIDLEAETMRFYERNRAAPVVPFSILRRSVPPMLPTMSSNASEVAGAASAPRPPERTT